MRCGNFSLLIPEGVERDSGHVAMAHGTVYTLRLGNRFGTKCDAEVIIDGKDMGTYRINGWGQITLERAFNDSGRFTFFKSDSEEGQAAGAGEVRRDDKGLIVVRFKPEKRYQPVPTVMRSTVMHGTVMRSADEKTSGGIRTRGFGPQAQGMGADASSEASFCDPGESRGVVPVRQSGVTGLTGHSTQNFYHVEPLDYDPSGEVTITVRLICETSPHGTPVRKMQPVSQSTPTPAPVD